MSTYDLKGVDSRVPIEIRYRRAWTYQGVGVSEASTRKPETRISENCQIYVGNG